MCDHDLTRVHTLNRDFTPFTLNASDASDDIQHMAVSEPVVLGYDDLPVGESLASDACTAVSSVNDTATPDDRFVV
jgi:hypothetical protein